MTPEREAEIVTRAMEKQAMAIPLDYDDGEALLVEVKRLTALLAEREAEIGRHREFVEAMVSPCEWGPGAFVSDDEADLEAVAVRLGFLVERPHAQPCLVEDCGCDGSETLLHFAWTTHTGEQG